MMASPSGSSTRSVRRKYAIRQISRIATLRSCCASWHTRSARVAITLSGVCPLTASTKGKPKRPMYCAFRDFRRANCACVNADRPAPFCSLVDADVTSPRRAARPASSGCARIKRELQRLLGLKDRLAHGLMQGNALAKGRNAATRSGTQGECSNIEASAATKSRAEMRIESLERYHGSTGSTADPPASGPKGCVAIQCRAISTRRQIHTRSCAPT